jgi:hypothetical protein
MEEKKLNSHNDHEGVQLDKQFDCTCIRPRSPIYFGLHSGGPGTLLMLKRVLVKRACRDLLASISPEAGGLLRVTGVLWGPFGSFPQGLHRAELGPPKCLKLW